jgi:hypothetical protein
MEIVSFNKFRYVKSSKYLYILIIIWNVLGKYISGVFFYG